MICTLIFLKKFERKIPHVPEQPRDFAARTFWSFKSYIEAFIIYLISSVEEIKCTVLSLLIIASGTYTYVAIFITVFVTIRIVRKYIHGRPQKGHSRHFTPPLFEFWSCIFSFKRYTPTVAPPTDLLASAKIMWKDISVCILSSPLLTT